MSEASVICKACDDYGVLDGLEPCPEECAAWERVLESRTPGPCYRCGRTPAAGFASIWTAAEGERWYCHGDDDEWPTCYEGANVIDPDAFGAAGYLLLPPSPASEGRGVGARGGEA